jgi:hypothetical protein
VAKWAQAFGGQYVGEKRKPIADEQKEKAPFGSGGGMGIKDN